MVRFPRGNILFSSPSPGRPLTISQPSVSTETSVPSTQALTFLPLVLASWGERPGLSIMRSPGSGHVANRRRHLGRKLRCVAPHRRWVFTTAPTAESASFILSTNIKWGCPVFSWPTSAHLCLFLLSNFYSYLAQHNCQETVEDDERDKTVSQTNRISC